MAEIPGLQGRVVWESVTEYRKECSCRYHQNQQSAQACEQRVKKGLRSQVFFASRAALFCRIRCGELRFFLPWSFFAVHAALLRGFSEYYRSFLLLYPNENEKSGDGKREYRINGSLFPIRGCNSSKEVLKRASSTVPVADNLCHRNI